MDWDYYIGVDGGGSGTRARVLAADGRLLGVGTAGPSGLAQGLEQAWRNVLAAIASVWGPAAAACDRAALGLGLAGAHDKSFRQAFLSAAPAFGELVLETDGRTTLLGAHAGRPGMVVAVGTGSVGEALRADGRWVEVGGWGFPVGDEGSGAWLGLRAMAHAQRAFDGREPAGELARAVWQHAGPGEDRLRRWCAGAGQSAYAALAPLVFDHEAADPVAAALLARALQALEQHAQALDPAAQLPLVVAGSIGNRLAPRLPAALQARRVESSGDAMDGALRLVGAPAALPT